jgi:hypothetical protein
MRKIPAEERRQKQRARCAAYYKANRESMLAKQAVRYRADEAFRTKQRTFSSKSSVPRLKG